MCIKSQKRKRFGKKVCKLNFSGNARKDDCAMLIVMSNKMTIKLNVFDLFTEDVIKSNVDDTFVFKI